MKKSYSLFTILSLIFYTNSVYAQFTNVITGLYKPTVMFLYGDDLYFTDNYADEISKIDITQSSPTKTIILSGLNGVGSIAIKDSILYF